MKKIAHTLLLLLIVLLLSAVSAKIFAFTDGILAPDAPFFGWASLFATPFFPPVNLLAAHLFAPHRELIAFGIWFVRWLSICVLVCGIFSDGRRLAKSMAVGSLLVFCGAACWPFLLLAMLIATFWRKPRVKTLLAIWGIPLANVAVLAMLGWIFRGDPLDPLRVPSPKEIYSSFEETPIKQVFDNDYLRREIKDRIGRMSDSPIVFVLGMYSRGFVTEEPFVWQPFGDIPPTEGKDVYVLVPAPVARKRFEPFHIKDKRFYGMGKKGWRMIGTFQNWHLFRVEAK